MHTEDEQTRVIDWLKQFFVVLTVVASFATSVQDLFTGTPIIIVAFVVLIITVSWSVHVFRAKKPRTVMLENNDIPNEPRYKWKMKTVSILFILAAVVSLGMGASRHLFSRGVPEIQFFITNHALKTLNVDREAEFFIHRPATPATQTVITTGYIDLTTADNTGGPWITIPNSNLFRMCGAFRSDNTVLEALEEGADNIQIVFSINGRFVAKNVTFNRKALTEPQYIRLTRFDLP